MAVIPKDLGSGGSFLAPEQGGPKASLVEVLNGLADDQTALGTFMTALTQKLDLDGGITDTDYEATLDPSFGAGTFPGTTKET